ncbi:hypothetical protein [Candidatus Solincola tengchongensis]|uniref:hypothetical protein n=1 Tax=Candidatus Solincola tengchongensis TaxID=2900693 RepID=UPI00257CD100|nr:hypothetical protein [Candidatus Solincola tengchongensis]
MEKGRSNRLISVSRAHVGGAMVVLGCLLCMVSALLAPWSRAQARWKKIPFLGEVDLGSVTGRLTDNASLAVIAVILSIAGIACVAWKSKGWLAALLTSVLLMLVFIAYLVGITTEAYETLGFYKRLLDLLRGIPYLGAVAGWIEETVRQNVTFTVKPMAGFYLFPASALLIAVGSLVMRARPGESREAEGRSCIMAS